MNKGEGYTKITIFTTDGKTHEFLPDGEDVLYGQFGSSGDKVRPTDPIQKCYLVYDVYEVIEFADGTFRVKEDEKQRDGVILEDKKIGYYPREIFPMDNIIKVVPVKEKMGYASGIVKLDMLEKAN